MRLVSRLIAGVALAILLFACSQPAEDDANAAAPVETAEEFVARVNAESEELSRESGAANWVSQTYITPDTALIYSRARERRSAWHSEMVEQAAQYDGQDLAPATRRSLELLKLGTSLPAPSDPGKRRELTQIATDMKGMYGAGKYCRDDGECLGGNELESLMETSRDYDELLDYWTGWRTVSVPMRDMYSRYVELANEGAAEFGYSDLGELWRAKFDMSPAEFQAEAERLWQQVKPLYEELHCHVRAKLGEHYGEEKIPQDQPIPAHVLGNMWGQTWGFLYDLMEPYAGIADFDVDSTLKTKNYSPQEMTRNAESFYVSLGMPRLPDTFWERSQFTKPADRDVVCHASAWNLDGDERPAHQDVHQPDLRRVARDLPRAGTQLLPARLQATSRRCSGPVPRTPVSTKPSATRSRLSMTPDYLAEVGLVDSARDSREAGNHQPPDADGTGQDCVPAVWQAHRRVALESLFNGETSRRTTYNAGLVGATYASTRASCRRSSAPRKRTSTRARSTTCRANVSYTRYFLAHVLQFQFQRSLCESGRPRRRPAEPARSTAARRLARTPADHARGGQASQPWQDTLEKP